MWSAQRRANPRRVRKHGAPARVRPPQRAKNQDAVAAGTPTRSTVARIVHGARRWGAIMASSSQGGSSHDTAVEGRRPDHVASCAANRRHCAAADWCHGVGGRRCSGAKRKAGVDERRARGVGA